MHPSGLKREGENRVTIVATPALAVTNPRPHTRTERVVARCIGAVCPRALSLQDGKQFLGNTPQCSVTRHVVGTYHLLEGAVQNTPSKLWCASILLPQASVVKAYALALW